MVVSFSKQQVGEKKGKGKTNKSETSDYKGNNSFPLGFHLPQFLVQELQLLLAQIVQRNAFSAFNIIDT